MERQYYYGIDVILAETICFIQPEIPSEFLKKLDVVYKIWPGKIE